MTTLLLTCAGLSTRFPGERPKWTLTHPFGSWMGVSAICGLTSYDRLVVAVRGSHLSSLGGEAISNAFAPYTSRRPEIVDVGESESHVQTVRRALSRAEVRGPFVAKDCDNFFVLDLAPLGRSTKIPYAQQHPFANWVAVAAFADYPRVSAGNKGTVQIYYGNVQALSDGPTREVIGPHFLAGAYSFGEVDRFQKHSDKCSTMAGVVESMMRHDRIVFYDRPVADYEDWGTLEDWRAACATYKTLFVDIDGVLVHSSFPPRWSDSTAIAENVAALVALQERGRVQIVFTTARPEAVRTQTEAQLRSLGLHPYALVMGLFNAERVIVNDVAPGRAPSARALCIARDAPVLRQLLEEL